MNHHSNNIKQQLQKNKTSTITTTHHKQKEKQNTNDKNTQTMKHNDEPKLKTTEQKHMK